MTRTFSVNKAPRGFVPYCVTYHCAGDCGLPHNQDERVSQFTAAGRAKERKRLTLAASDSLEHADKSAQMDASSVRTGRATDAAPIVA